MHEYISALDFKEARKDVGPFIKEIMKFFINPLKDMDVIASAASKETIFAQTSWGSR